MKNMENNIILMTDSYKATHAKAYVKGIEHIYSYMESRGGQYKETLFFGLQYYLKKYLTGVQVTKEKIDEAEIFWQQHFGRSDCFNREGWEYILKVHGGKLPLRIKAVKEGSIVPTQNVLLTIENTDSKCYWLTNYVETILMRLWYPITQSTRSLGIKKDILKHLDVSGTPDSISFKCHDFGYRGCNSEEHAAIGSAAHLLSFMGTDTVAGIRLLQKYYSSDMCGFSIPATEHSIMCSFGREHELEACENFLNTYPSGLIACVSDTYNIFKCCSDIWGGELKDKVINRDGTLVVRPDCYDEQTEILTENGWTFFKDLKNNIKVAQYNKDGSIDFVLPSKYVNEKYQGDMIKFTDKKGRIDLLVTPNHRMINLYNKKEIKVKYAEEQLLNHTYDFFKSGEKIIGKKEKLSSYDRLLIAFQADGSYPSKKGKNDGSICGHITVRFNFTKKRKVERLKKILNKGGFKYKISIEPSRPNNTQIYVQLPSYPSKTFDWIKLDDITSNWGKDFIEELSYWDATSSIGEM